MNHFAVHLKLTQCCKATVLQGKKKPNKRTKTKKHLQLPTA